MSNFKYTPDEDTKVHEEGAIKLICKPFQSHESGLPEWAKNSSDAYIRENSTPDKRTIILFLNDKSNKNSPTISCLDFVGMTSEIIEEDFRHWADPDAAKRRGKTAVGLQGGHGNGGKCYMTQMFEDYAFLHTVKKGIGNKYGVHGGFLKFGYVPDSKKGKDFQVTDIVKELNDLLSSLNCSIKNLPQKALDTLKIADGFTMFSGIGAKGYTNKIKTQQLITSIQEHPQMIGTLELCDVFVMINGKPFNDGKPLSLPKIEPLPEATEPKKILIPELLKDPISEEKVSTTKGGLLPQGQLDLLTSKTSMRYSKKGRHRIIYKAQSGFIGYVEVPELNVQSSYSDKIYGYCVLQSLEEFKQNERASLAKSPLTRAVENFISEKLSEYAKEFERKDQRKYNQKEKDAISRINEALDKWKNKFLTNVMRGMYGSGQGLHDGSPTNLPKGKAATIELSLSHRKAGVGVSIKPKLKFFDSDRKRIRSVPYQWVSEDTNVAFVDHDLMLINTFSLGDTVIYAETMDGKIQSNKLPLEVVRFHNIEINPTKVELSAGSRYKLTPICILPDGEETDDVYLVWTEGNPNVASVSSAGLVYGFEPGETEIIAGDDNVMSNPANITVKESDGKGSGKEKGKGFPKILISEFDKDPDTMDDVIFSKDDPPVWQRPIDVDRNIWWINTSAPLARMYLSQELDYGYNSREWRMYHLERYIEIMAQIALLNAPEENELLSAGEWILFWGSKVAEIQNAAHDELKEFITNGQLPE